VEALKECGKSERELIYISIISVRVAAILGLHDGSRGELQRENPDVVFHQVPHLGKKLTGCIVEE
jgi:hypothetical protein